MSITNLNNSLLSISKTVVSAVENETKNDDKKPEAKHNEANEKIQEMRAKKDDIRTRLDKIDDKVGGLRAERQKVFDMSYEPKHEQEIKELREQYREVQKQVSAANDRAIEEMRRGPLTEESSKRVKKFSDEHTRLLEESRQISDKFIELQKEDNKGITDFEKWQIQELTRIDKEIKELDDQRNPVNKERQEIEEELRKLEHAERPVPEIVRRRLPAPIKNQNKEDDKNEEEQRRRLGQGAGNDGVNRGGFQGGGPQGVGRSRAQQNPFAALGQGGGDGGKNQNNAGLRRGGNALSGDGHSHSNGGGFGSGYIQSAKALLRAVLALMISAVGNNNPFFNVAKMLAGKSMVEVAKTLTEAGMTDEVVNKSPMLRHEALLVDTQAAGLRGIFETALQYWNQAAQANKQIAKDTQQLAQRA